MKAKERKFSDEEENTLWRAIVHFKEDLKLKKGVRVGGKTLIRGGCAFDIWGNLAYTLPITFGYGNPYAPPIFLDEMIRGELDSDPSEHIREVSLRVYFGFPTEGFSWHYLGLRVSGFEKPPRTKYGDRVNKVQFGVRGHLDRAIGDFVYDMEAAVMLSKWIKEWGENHSDTNIDGTWREKRTYRFSSCDETVYLADYYILNL